jgi:hypothetical protein
MGNGPQASSQTMRRQNRVLAPRQLEKHTCLTDRCRRGLNRLGASHDAARYSKQWKIPDRARRSHIILSFLSRMFHASNQNLSHANPDHDFVSPSPPTYPDNFCPNALRAIYQSSQHNSYFTQSPSKGTHITPKPLSKHVRRYCQSANPQVYRRNHTEDPLWPHLHHPPIRIRRRRERQHSLREINRHERLVRIPWVTIDHIGQTRRRRKGHR